MTRWPGATLLASVFVCLGTALLTGCGSEEQEPPSPSSMGEIVIVADQDPDREIGLALRRYMSRNCGVVYGPMPPMKEEWGPRKRDYVKRQFKAWGAVCRHAKTIEVNDQQITMTSGLAGDDLEDAGIAFCNLVQSADVADSTPGHNLLDLSGETITVCGTKNAYR